MPPEALARAAIYLALNRGKNVKPAERASSRPDLVYSHGDGLYVNLTNRCPVSCTFCIKRAWKMHFEGRDLRLAAEPSVWEILEALARSLGARFRLRPLLTTSGTAPGTERAQTSPCPPASRAD